MSNPWDVPPVPDKGDASPESIFLAVGRAMTQWEHLEAALGDFFAFLVGGDFGLTDPALRAYGSIVSFNQRATMLEEAASAYFHATPHPSFQERFHQLIKIECRNFAGRRNDIAHGLVEKGFDKSGGLSNFLIPGRYASKKWKPDQPPHYLYSSKEIDYFAEQFAALYDQVAALVNEMHFAP